jgi:hypothetical protein
VEVTRGFRGLAFEAHLATQASPRNPRGSIIVPLVTAVLAAISVEQVRTSTFLYR